MASTWTPPKPSSKKSKKIEVSKKFINDFYFIANRNGIEAAIGWAEKNKPKTLKEFTKGKVYLNGKYVTEDEARKWQKGIPDRWTREQIAQLEVELGLEPTGSWSTTLAKRHLRALKDKTKFGEESFQGQSQYNTQRYLEGQARTQQRAADSGNWVATDKGVVKMSSDAADKYYAEKQYEEMLKSRQQERSRIQDDMMNTWKNLTGVNPTEANVNWGTEKVLQGWGYDDFFFWMKDRPEMKKMYPGMPNGMLPSEYGQVRDTLNAAYMENVGRPLNHDEVANIMKGGDFPEDDFFLGQPAIRDEELG